MTGGTGSARLAMRGVEKRFGATTALDGVAFMVQPGEVHALVGENGAGKSTLMKILAGAVRPDAGTITLDGRSFAPGDPLAARDAGIAMIYQELNLAPDLTVEQNLTLGVEHHTCGVVRNAAHRRQIREVLAALHRPDIHLAAPVRQLPPAARQVVEIARALLSDARVLVMDEPTSSLGLADIEQLFALITRLRDRGVSIVYISHFLEEIQRVADRYTVLRDGRVAARGTMRDTTLPDLVEHMIGRRLDEMFPRVAHDIGAPLLHLDDLTGRRLPTDISLQLRRGEILGLAGLVGAGRTELARAISGLDPVRRGTIRVGAVTLDRRGTPADRLRSGIGLLSEDRQREGLALGRTIADNLTLSHLTPFSTCGWLSPRRMHARTRHWMAQLDIRARHPAQHVGELSGGNQQKVAFGRLLHHDVDVLLLDEPTRGVDVASKTQIYRLIGELAARGKAVLFVSSTVPELLGICDRIAVMHRGRLVANRPVTDWTEHEIVATAASGREEAV